MKNIITFFGALLMILQVQAQDLSAYKYIIIPQQFSFQKEPNQYKVNKLTKFLFKKYGFDAYLAGEIMPPDANANGCNTLNMEAESGGFLGTHLTYTLANCRGEVVYTSPEGKSKIKQYEGAYNEVMREAMIGLEDLGYTYSDEVIPVKNTTPNTAMTANAENENPMQAQPNSNTKTVVVRAVPETAQNPKTTTTPKTKADQQQNSEMQGGAPKGAPKEAITVKNEPEMSKNYDIYTSNDGSYMLKRTSSGFDFYEGDTKIGEARRTSAGSFLVNTSEFVGVGSLEGDTFTVEREIKGVEGLIKMEFKAGDQ
ncbi:MAG TPA: hypothetical protein ENH91_12290 [Leeuwenhoekiella sp.]|nr:hypothetical protein [Leeuwenhoekiella sp.]